MNIFTTEEITQEDQLEIVRHNLSNLLSTYADEADVFTEIVQNSFDTLKHAIAEDLYNDQEKPMITIVIGRRRNDHHYIYVGDNGVGMERDIARKIAVQGWSHKKEKGRTIGYKGVGASYFFATSQIAALKTISDSGKKSEFTVRGAYSWITSQDSPPPTTLERFQIPKKLETLANFDRGTAVYFEFHEAMRPSSLNNVVIIGDGHEAEADNWVSYLAGKTAIGSVEDISGLSIRLNLYLDLGEDLLGPFGWTVGEYSREHRSIGYPFPIKLFGHKKDVDELDRIPERQREPHRNRYQAVYKRWGAEEIINETNLEDRSIEKLREQLLWVDGYLCSSTKVLKEINATLGGRQNIIRHGIKLASDGTPQGRVVDLSLTSSQGLDRQSHIVMAFNGLELDPGRKICADEDIANAIPEIGKRVVSILKDYRWAFKKEDRPDPTSDLGEWAKAITDRSEDSLIPDLYKAHDFENILEVDPGNEQEVIALFISLLERELLKGYKIRAISGFNRYDSLVNISTETPEVTNNRDALSIRSHSFNDGINKVLEFKYSFDSVLEDFDDKIKNPREIDIVVCWSLNSINVARGRIEPTYGDWRDERPVYGGSYLWVDDNGSASFPVIALRNLVLELLYKKEMENQEPGLGKIGLKKLMTRDKEARV